MEFMMFQDDDDEGMTRYFDPRRDIHYSRIPADQLITYNTDKKVLQLRHRLYSGELRVEKFTMVVYIDGACRRNGHPDARGSYGLYFGPDSPYNTFGLLPADELQTSTRAEIEALKQALDAIGKICGKDYSLRHVKIATDSEYLVDAMTSWIYEWVTNDGKRSNGKPAKHFDLLKTIHEQLDHMRYSDDGGIECQLWQIDREDNHEADALANEALDTV
jgi:ribonuclease HI